MPCAALKLRRGAIDRDAQLVVMHTLANSCDLIRNIPAFRTFEIACPMTAVLLLYENAHAYASSDGCLLLPLMALQLVRLAPIFWEVGSSVQVPVHVLRMSCMHHTCSDRHGAISIRPGTYAC